MGVALAAKPAHDSTGSPTLAAGLVPARIFLIAFDHPLGESIVRNGLIALVTIHSSIASGEFALITTTASRNLSKGNSPGADGTHILLDPGLAAVQIQYVLEAEVNPDHAARQSRDMIQYSLKYIGSPPMASATPLAKTALLFPAIRLHPVGSARNGYGIRLMAPRPTRAHP